MKIVITGGTKGIGREIARNLAEAGFSLAICARTWLDLEALRDELLTHTPCEKIFIRAFDIRDRMALENFARDVLDEFGSVDVLINNAGIFIPDSILNEKPETFKMIMETNLYSAYFLTKQILPSMIHNHKGHVINLCSVASLGPYPNGSSYSISKHALLGFGKNLREEVRQYGIQVTNILPGATWTSSWEETEIPKERLVAPTEVAKVVRTAIELDNTAMMEEIIIRPMQGDL